MFDIREQREQNLDNSTIVISEETRMINMQINILLISFFMLSENQQWKNEIYTKKT